jgi:glycosyltransferase involved in cell wall biosynthesis
VKVCHLIDHMGLGGAQKMVLDLMEGRGPSVEPSVISLRGGSLSETLDRLKVCGVSYRTLGLTKANPLGILRLRQALSETKIDLLHVHLDYSNIFGIAAALSLGARRPILLSHIHDDPLSRHPLWFRVALAAVASQVEAHVTATPGVAEATMKGLWHRPRRMEVVPPGINLNAFSAERCAEPAISELRRDAEQVVGVVARLAPQKAIHSALEAMPHLLSKEPSTRLLVVGEGPSRPSLEAQCERLGISESVTFLGYVSDVATAYAAMDVLVLPSQHEGFGIVLIEAMAMGVPVVATKVRGIEEVVDDGDTGLLVPYDNPQALASNILRLFDDRDLRTRLKAAARSKVERNYTRERMVRDFEALYADLACSTAPHDRSTL